MRKYPQSFEEENNFLQKCLQNFGLLNIFLHNLDCCLYIEFRIPRNYLDILYCSFYWFLILEMLLIFGHKALE